MQNFASRNAKTFNKSRHANNLKRPTLEAKNYALNTVGAQGHQASQHTLQSITAEVSFLRFWNQSLCQGKLSVKTQNYI